MKRAIRTILIAAICVALSAPVAVEARGHNDSRNDQRTSQSNNSRRGHGNHSSSNNNRRPGNRPGNNNGHRPDNRPGNRPGGHHPGGQRPPQRPGSDWNHHRPTHRPGNPSFGHHRPPHRPGNHWGHYRPHGHIPRGYVYYRPVPPPYSYRPYYNWPSFSTILGIQIGSAITSAINTLVASGYNVAGSTADAVYVNNVRMAGMMWPDAVLSFNSTGGLAGSEYIYSTAYDDTAVFRSVYSTLLGTYGQPYLNSGSEISWWGPDGQYISLRYRLDNSYDGGRRYYTTLNFGVM